jgi:hypothetical protein
MRDFILHNLHEKSAGVKLNAPLIESVKISISGERNVIWLPVRMLKFLII